MNERNSEQCWGEVRISGRHLSSQQSEWFATRGARALRRIVIGLPEETRASWRDGGSGVGWLLIDVIDMVEVDLHRMLPGLFAGAAAGALPFAQWIDLVERARGSVREAAKNRE